MIALLGTDTDVNVAAELDISEQSVAYRRRLLGIPPYAGPPPQQDSEAFWTSSRRALLGTASDSDVARRLKIPKHVVSYRRRTLSIPPFQPRAAVVRWTPEMRRWLGQAPDMEVAARLGIGLKAVTLERTRRKIAPWKDDSWPVIRDNRLIPILRLATEEAARRLGVTKETVHRLRKDLGVPPPVRRDSGAWTPRALARLGRVPDETLAEELGLSPITVALKRQKLGRPKHNARYRLWTPEEEALLGTAPDIEVARRIHRSARSVRRRRQALGRPSLTGPGAGWTSANLARLGREPDEVVARDLGLAVETVSHKRQKLGRVKRRVRPWTAAEVAQLGTAPDAEIAHRIGRTAGAVRRHRSKMGIPIYTPA